MRDDGERISRGRLDQGSRDAQATREALLMVGIFAAAVLINGLLAIVGIEALQALGVWPTPEATPDAR